MLSFLERGRQRARWIEAEAESLIQHLGPGAFDAAGPGVRPRAQRRSSRRKQSMR